MWRSALGARLFRDRWLSSNRERSCESCHRPDLGFTDGRAKALGWTGETLGRNTPTLFGIGAAPRFRWDGSAASIPDYLARAVTDPDTMAGRWGLIAQRLRADPVMARQFETVFGGRQPVSRTHIQRALEAYVRSLVPPWTRFDRWIAGWPAVAAPATALLTDQERLGFEIFVGRGQCVACHTGWRFTDDELHDTGRAGHALSGQTRFKTPTLRELVSTAPYFHDRAAGTLEDAVRHYERLDRVRPGLSAKLARGLALSDGERARLVAFLATLSVRPTEHVN